MNIVDISRAVERTRHEIPKKRRIERNQMRTLGGEDIPIEDQDFVQEHHEKKKYLHLGVEELCTFMSPGLNLCITIEF